MLWWLRRRRETAERIEAEAEAVMRQYAVRAYAEARRREREANSKAEAQNWNRVALAIANKTGKRVGLDTGTRMASDANFVASLETSASPPRAPASELDPLEESVRLVSEDSARGQYRVQFLGPQTDQGPYACATAARLLASSSPAGGRAGSARCAWGWSTEPFALAAAGS